MRKAWLKNTALATILSTTLAACGGGGGGGGGVPVVFDPPSVTDVAFNSAINGELVSDFISVVHDLSQDEWLDVKDAVEIFNWVESNKTKFANNELENYKITVDGQEMSLQKGFNMILGFKKKYYDGKETFWQDTANTGKLDDENEHFLALKDIAEEDLAKTKEDYYNELESTGTATLVETVEEPTTIYKFGAITEQNPVITYSDWQVQETNAIAPEVSSETTTETDNAGDVYEVVTTTTTPITEHISVRDKTVSVSSTQLKKTYNEITTWYIYSNGAKTKDIKQVFVSEESVAYGSPKVTITTETKSETVAGESDIKVKKTLKIKNISFNTGINAQMVSDFISVVHDLSQDEVVDVEKALEIFNWVETNELKFNNNELENYKITIDGQETSLQKGFNILLGFKKKYYDGKETFWQNVADTGKLDDEDEDYLALKSTALEDTAKDKTEFYNELESTGKATVVNTSQTNSFDYTYSDPTASDPVVSYTDWSLSSSTPGESTISTTTVQETDQYGVVYEVVTTSTATPTVQTWTRTINSSVAYTKVKTTIKTTTTYTQYSNGVKSMDITKTTSTETVAHGSPELSQSLETKTVTVENDPVVTTERTLIENPVLRTETLDPIEDIVITEGDPYTETTSVLGDATSTYTEEGSATTETSYTYGTSDVDNGDGTVTRTTTKYTVTTTTLPITTYTTKVRTYTDRTYKDVTTTTTTTPRLQKFYANGTDEIVLGTAIESQSIVKTPVSTTTRSVTEIVDSEVNNTVNTSTDEGVIHLVQTISTAYTDADTNLGTRTTGYDTDKTTYETSEYNESNQGYKVYEKINVSSAYSRGWTGKGSIVAVADTGYDVDHSEFEGQVVATKDYTGTGINDNQGHGSHVLGTIVGKKDGAGMHGVAFDAKAVVVKIGDGRSVSLDSAINGLAWAADQGAIVGNLSANSNYDSWFRNSITKMSDGAFKTTSLSYDYSAGKYYNNMSVDGWKTITDKGMVLVNSAGNQGLDVSAMPGWFATETDADGNLVLGGKVLIVGSYNFSTNNIDGFSNKAGHLCRVVVADTCRDKYKTSDFYVLAPGWTYSASNDGGYDNNTGTSMAAPVVTAQVAILHQMWPHMKGENLVKLVTSTADKSIPGYDVNIHGQGVVDFDEATKPQGAIGIPTTGRVDGAISSVSDTYISGSGSIQAAISNIKIMVIDDFDRDYYLNLGNSFTVKDNRKYSDVQMLVDNKNTFLPQQQMYGSFAQGGQWDLAKDYNFGFYTGENGDGDYSVNVGKDFYVGNNFKLKTSLGHMSEQETWLGNSSDGVLSVGDNNDTLSKNIGVEYQIGNNVLSLDYSKGKTDFNTVDDSLIKSFSDVRTESYRLAYEIHKDKHNTLGWSFSLPSHITSGTIDLEVAESVNLDGTINYTNIRSDLTQSTKEKNIGFYLNHTPTHDTDAAYKFTAEYRQDVAGESGRDGVNLAMNYTKKFWGSCKFLWMKNPKCYTKGKDGKEVLTAQHQAMMFGNNDIDTATMHGLKYDLKTDKFIPINPEDEKWKQ